MTGNFDIGQNGNFCRATVILVVKMVIWVIKWSFWSKTAVIMVGDNGPNHRVIWVINHFHHFEISLIPSWFLSRSLFYFSIFLFETIENLLLILLVLTKDHMDNLRNYSISKTASFHSSNKIFCLIQFYEPEIFVVS